jgi:predicted nucleic acid-binding protein
LRSAILDASVAAKWMLSAKDELLYAEADQLLSDYETGRVNLSVPGIFWAECGNIAWKAVRQQRLEQEEAESAIQLMIQRQFPTVSSEVLLPSALSIALQYGRSVYDALYVALAVQSKRDLITADERLANALAARFPVKWLGAF